MEQKSILTMTAAKKFAYKLTVYQFISFLNGITYFPTDSKLISTERLASITSILWQDPAKRKIPTHLVPLVACSGAERSRHCIR
jgi:hypothetical protein